MGVPVAPEEALEAENLAIVGAADDHRTYPDLEEGDTPQDEGAHGALAEVGLLHHEIAQPVRRNDEGLDRGLGFGVDQRRPAGELGKLAQERAWAISDDGLRVAVGGVVGDGDLAGKDDDHARRDLADPREKFTLAIGPHLAETSHSYNIGRRQSRKHLAMSRFDERGRHFGHDRSRNEHDPPSGCSFMLASLRQGGFAPRY